MFCLKSHRWGNFEKNNLSDTVVTEYAVKIVGGFKHSFTPSYYGINHLQSIDPEHVVYQFFRELWLFFRGFKLMEIIRNLLFSSE